MDIYNKLLDFLLSPDETNFELGKQLFYSQTDLEDDEKKHIILFIILRDVYVVEETLCENVVNKMRGKQLPIKSFDFEENNCLDGAMKVGLYCL